MRQTFKQIDILNSTIINEAELLIEVNIEISVLKGLDILKGSTVVTFYITFILFASP